MMHVVSLFKEKVQNFPDHPALQAGNKIYSYRTVEQQSDLIAVELIQHYHVEKNDVVVLHSSNEPWVAVLILAVWKVGGVICLVDETLPAARKKLVLSATKATYIISKQTNDNTDDDFLKDTCQITIDIDQFSQKKITSLISLPELDQQDNAYIFFTSGSTGQPKGILAKHAALAHFLTWQRDEFEIDCQDICYQVTKVSFDVILRSIFTPLISGACVVFPEHSLNITDVNILFDLINHQVTFFHCVPTLMDIWLTQLEKPVSFPTLKYLFFAGEKLTENLFDKINQRMSHNGEYVNLYGPSETVLAKFYYRFSSIDKNRDIPVGKALPDTAVYIIDRDNNHICEVNQPGEVAIVTPYCSEGYLSGNPAFDKLPEAVNISDDLKAYYTGDSGFIDARGFLHITGRINDEIKINGVKVNLLEVEHIISEYPCITRAICTYNNQYQLIEAYLKIQDDALFKDLQAFYEYLETSLLVEMIPGRFYQVEEFVYTSSGKVSRRETTQIPDKINIALTSSDFSTHDDVEREVTQAIQNEFNILPGLNDSLYRYGINSLKLILFMAKFSESLNRSIKIGDIAFPSIKAIAHTVKKINGSKDNTPKKTAPQKTDCRINTTQQSIFNFTRLFPLSPAYNVIYAFKFDHGFESQLYVDFILSTCQRHPILASKISESPEGDINLVIRDDWENTLYETIQGISEDHIEAYLNNIASTPMDINKELFHCYIIHTNENTYVVNLFHHLIVDGYSTSLFVENINTFQASRSYENNIKNLSNQRIHFKNRLFKPDARLYERFWRYYLLGYQKTFIPGDLTTIASEHGKSKWFKMPGDLTIEVEKILPKDVSAFSFYFSVFAILTSRLVGKDVVNIAVPVSQRGHFADESINCYVGALPLIVNAREHLNVLAYAKKISRIIKLLTDNADESIATLLKRYGVEINHSLSSNIFDVYFSYDDVFHNQVNFNGVYGKRIHSSSGEAKYPFSLMMHALQKEVYIEIEFGTSIYSDGLVDQIFEYYINLLKQLTNHPDQQINSVILKPQAIIQKYNAHHYSTKEYDHNILSWILKIAEQHPNDIAIKDLNNKEYTYNQLLALSNKIALAIDTHYPEIIAVIAPKSFEQLAALLGVFISNNIYLPVDPQLPEKRVALMINHSNATYIISQDRQHYLRISNKKKQQDIELNCSIISSELKKPSGIKKPLPKQPAYILYTSGTTGQPKAVIQTHQTLNNLINYQINQLPGIAKPTVTQMASLSFDVSLQEIFYALCTGGHLILCNQHLKLSPEELWSTFHKSSVDVTFLPPAVLQLLAEAIDEAVMNQNDHLSLKHIICAGEQLKITDSIRNFFYRLQQNIRLHNHYGPTETHVVTAYTLPADVNQWGDFPPIGQPIQNTQAYMLNCYFDLLPYGIEGKLYIGGSNLALEYGKSDEQANKKFIHYFINDQPIRLYDTGDIAAYRNDYIHCYGRADSQISINGYRIEPNEIETIIQQANSLIDQVVVIKTSINQQAQLCCYFSAKIDIPVKKLIAHCSAELPAYMIPHFFIQIPIFPLTMNGKIDSAKLPSPKTLKASSAPKHQTANEPLTEIQNQLLETVKQFSDYPLTIHDSLLQTGISSLQIARLLASLSKQFNTVIYFRDLIQNPSIFLLEALIKIKKPLQEISANPKQFVKSKLSYQQRRIIFDIENGQNPVANNLSLVFKMPENIDLSSFKKAVKAIAEANDVFKLSLHQEYNHEQLVKGYSKFLEPLNLVVINTDPIKHINELVHHNYFPFDKGFGEFHLIKPKYHQDFYFVMVIHHLIFDGISIANFMNQLNQYFIDNMSSRHSVSEQVPYLNYINQSFDSYYQDNINYLKSCVSRIQNLTQINPQLLQSQFYYNYKSNLWFSLDSTSFKILRQLSSRCRVSLFCVFLYIYQTFVYDHKLVDQDKLLIGTTVSGRELSQTEHTLGLFSQRTLIQLNIINDDSSILDKLQYIQQRVKLALANQLLSIYELSEHKQLLNNKHIPTPQFNIVFQSNNEPKADSHQAFPYEIIPFENQYYSLDQTDLTLVIYEGKNSSDIEIVYNAEFYSIELIKNLKYFFLNFIENLKRI